MKEERITLDQEGLNQYLSDIESLKIRLIQIKEEKKTARLNSDGSNWHDEANISSIIREEERIKALLGEMMNNLSKARIIEKVQDKDEDIIDINDVVSIHMTCNTEDLGIRDYKLVAKDRPNMDATISEVTINSPLGKSIYLKRVGDCGSYKVLENVISYSILNKNNSMKL